MLETILLIGNGGREHAILERLILSKAVEKVIVCNNTYWDKPFHFKPEYSKVENHTLEDTSISSYIHFAKENKVGLVIVGPEKYLAEGIIDEFAKQEIMCFGPTKAMAQIETSKAYGKEIMHKLDLPTAEFRIYSTKDVAKEFLIDNIGNGYQVIKKDGLAGGKGVMVLKDATYQSLTKGLNYLDEIYEEDETSKILIEKKLSGVEVSVLAFCNGKKAYLMPPARDFKRIYDGDIGPNTGGMGAICPGDLLDVIQLHKVQAYMDSVVMNLGYKGVLYAGLMVNYDNKDVENMELLHHKYKNGYYLPGDNSTIHFLEFNCRFGDPETQSILPLLDHSSDLYEIMCKCMLGYDLRDVISWKMDMKSINVVMSHIEYPYKKMDTPVPIGFSNGLKRLLQWNKTSTMSLNISNVSFVKKEGNDGKNYKNDKDNVLGEYVTTGGRVLSLVVCGTNFAKCFTDVYSMCRRIIYKDMYYRMDIGKEYLIGFNRDNRVNHWHGYELMNIPTLAIFHGEKDSVDRVRVMVEFLSKCKNTYTGMIRLGLIVCIEKDYELMELSSEYKIPLLFINEEMNTTSETRDQVIDTLRSFNINMIISTDDYNGMHNDTKMVLFEEYGSKMLDISMNEHIFSASSGNIKRIISNLKNYFKIESNIKRDLHTFQFVNHIKQEQIIPTSSNNNMCIAGCFIEYLKLYNQRPLKYSVDIDGGNDFVEYLKEDNKEIGDFCYKCNIAGDVIGLATDGVGTKIDLALKYNSTNDIGIDLVAMSVNDLYVHGVKPTYFLDYLALDKMDINLCKKLVNSIRRGCDIADCNLVGGETAEMRGLYRSKKCDLGGFALGKCVDSGVNGIDSRRDRIEPGCLLFGLPSSGFHSNGFTLINDFVEQCYLNAALEDRYSILSISKIRTLLTPTRIYREIPDILRNTELKDSILGIAHITGGGFPDNVHRVLCRSAYKNKDTKSSPLTYELNFELEDMFDYLSEYAEENNINSGVREVSQLYKWIHKLTRCSMKDMFRTFNCGIGMVFVMKKGVDMSIFEKYGYNEFISLGEVVESME